MKHSLRKKKKLPSGEEKVADRMLNTSMHRIIGALINVPKVSKNDGTAQSSSTGHNVRSSKPHHSRRERRNNPSSQISPSTSEESGNKLQAVITSSKIENSPDERRSAPPETVTEAKDPISLPPATSWPTSPGSGSCALSTLDRGTSIGTFCTALSEQSGHHNSLHAADDDNTSMVSKTENVVGHNDDEDQMALDYAAEVAARSVFGSHSDQPLTMDSSHHRGSLHSSLHGGQISALRGSKLVSSVTGIDPSVFASRGLMSRRSFERYKKEMKNKVLKGASSNNNLKGMDFKSVRRASMSMCDLRNDTFDNNTAPHPAHLPSQHSSFKYVPSNRQQGRPQRRPTSVENSSGAAGVDYHFIESLVSSFKKEQDSNKLNSGEQQQQSRDTLFTTDEMVALTNMMRRLSQDETPKNSPANLIQVGERSPTRLDPCQTGLTSLIDAGPKGNDLCDSSSSESEDEVGKEALNSYPVTNTSLEGGSKQKQQVILNEIGFASGARDNSSKLGHLMPEVALTREQSSTSALTLTPLDRDVSMGTMNTGTNTSTIPLKTSFNRSDTLSTYLVDDMGERPDFDDRDFARTPSMPRIRRNTLSSESMGRPSSVATYDDPQLKEDCGDLLAEGMEYLSMAMLVNIYGKLREMSLLGHVSVKLRDIDVNSHQYNSRKKELKRLELWSAADEAKGYLDTTRNAGFIVRTVMDEHELFEAEHARGAANGANQAFLAYDANLLKDFKTWVEESRVKQLDSATEGIIKKIREECYKHQVDKEKMVSSNQLKSSFGSSSSVADVGLSLSRRRGSLMDISESFQGASWMEQERKLIEDHFGIRNGLPMSRREPNRRTSLSGTDLSSSFISKAIEDSTDCFFEEGSVMKNLLKSGFEVVWFADRHPKDIAYGICVNRDTATVSVVFRGQEGIFDLCRDTTLSSFPNPIAHEDYEGNSETIKLRSAVADEILRVRLDTKMSLISEIREKIVIIGQELASLTNGAGYHLSVVGHSRGGGYATILGYYLTSDMYLDLASAVRVFTYAASPVGNTDFLNGFKHLEEQGRLLHARFANSNDLSSSLPLKGYSEETDMKETYQHVGMQVRLHKANEAGRRRIKQSLDVCYGAKEPILREMARCVINVLCPLKALLCFVFYKNQCVSQYHLRMHFAREYRLALGDGALRFDKKRKYLKTLNEYYIMKCRNVYDFTGFYDKGSAMPTWAAFVVVACLLMLQIDIFFKFSAGWYSGIK